MGEKDILEKRLIRKNEVFADIFNNIVFRGRQILDSAALQSMPAESNTRRPGGRWRQGYRDIRKADRNSQQYRLICGIENQQDTDNTMPIRNMGYDYAAYEEQITELQAQNRANHHPAYTKGLHDDQKLVPVVTTVLFFGKDWTGPRSLHELLAFPEAHRDLLEQLVPDYHLNLIRMDELPEEVIERLTSDFRFVAEYYAGRKHPEKLHALFTDNTRRIQYPEELLELLGEISGDSRYQELADHIFDEEGEEVTMCIIADKLEQRGVERGIAQGLERGMAKGLERGMAQGRTETLELVSRMVLNGDADLIASLSNDDELYQRMYRKYFCS